MSSPAERLGLVALGDSITVGDGEPALGVSCRPWALWLARALELPYTNLAVDGAVASELVHEQLPRVRASYDLACLYVGVNDARGPCWEPDSFARFIGTALAHLGAHAQRVMALTIPLDLGRPRAGTKVAEANALIVRLAAEHGALVARLDDLRGPTLLLPDAVHPTAIGQLEIADRAAQALAAAGVAVPQMPSTLAAPRRARRARARFAARWGAMLVRDLLRRAIERRAGPRGADDVSTPVGDPPGPGGYDRPVPRSAFDTPAGAVADSAAHPSLGDRLRALRIWARRPRRIRMRGGTLVGRGVRVDVAPGARLLIGESAELGDGCRLEVHGGSVEIGDGAVLGEGCTIVARAGVRIGAGCRLEDGVAIIDCGRRFGDVEVPIRLQALAAAPVQIDPGAILGPRAVVLPGVRVGAGARVGARFVVESDVPAGAFVEGLPGLTPGDGRARRAAGRRPPRGPHTPRR